MELQGVTSSRLTITSALFLISLSVSPLSIVNCQQQNTTASVPTVVVNHNNAAQQELSSFLALYPSTQKQVSTRGSNGLLEDNNSNNDNQDHRDSLSSVVLKTYIRAHKMRAYHLDMHSYRPEAKFSGDPAFVDSENPTHKMRCARHLNQYKYLLKSFIESDPVHDNNSLYSIRLADTFGRPESGALAGNQYWLGSYDNCLDFQYQQSQQQQASELIKSQYCLGITQFPNWNSKHSLTSIKVGLCLPETCTTSMLNEDSEMFETVETMMKYQFGAMKPYSLLKLRDIYCLPHETSQVRKYSASALGFVAVISFFVLASLVATTIDYLNSKMPTDLKPKHVRNWRTILIESFSLTRNINKLVEIREDGSAQQEPPVEGTFNRSVFLDSQSGIKCIGLFWIIAAHTFLVATVMSRNIIEADKVTQTYLANIFLSANLMVDTFFALSGILTAYFVFKNGVNNVKPIEWVIATIHRYWRLTPVYLICYWFTKSVGHLVNSGPMWDYMTSENSQRLQCARESWWDAVLQLSDLKSPKDHCIPFAWFIANSIKFFVVTPFFLALINKSMRRGYMVTIGAILANIMIVMILAARSPLDIKTLIEFKPESANSMLNQMGTVYTAPYSRIGPYLIGLLAGHLIYLVEVGQLRVRLSEKVKITIWTVFCITVTLLTFILKFANGVVLEEAALRPVFTVSTALIRPLWAMCTCWLLFALAQNLARPVARFLSSKFWRILVKLSFCGYLAQVEVIAQVFLSPKSPSHFVYSDLILRAIVAIVLTVAASVPMVLILEYPLQGIEEIILRKRRISHETKAETGEVVQNQECEKLKTS